MMIWLLFIIVLEICFATDNTGCCSPSYRQGFNNKFNILRDFNVENTCPHYTNNDGAFEEAEMILIPAGVYQVGTDDILIESDREGPKRLIELKSFYMDKYEVSNEDFNNFWLTTGYESEAEQFGDSFVFSMFFNSSFREKTLDLRSVQSPWWIKLDGVDWKHPYGADSNISDIMDHPVVHVSWNDAKNYCAWRGARLPTEAEWEAACRAGQQDTLFPWGNKLLPNKKHMANLFQGTFPHHNSEKDGFFGTCPVDLFSQNSLGFHNMAGNVWEWVEDLWSTDKRDLRVKKGGSFLCHRSYCYRYRCSARSQNSDESSAVNLGFRCAKNTS